MPDGGDENQLMDELRRLEQSARNYQQEVSFSKFLEVFKSYQAAMEYTSNALKIHDNDQ